ncbi:nuclear transport factor 2 family protein [Phormidium tenue FACHB-886]|nr:nuclear transport factor 2 family protein [Phormidium tenue FACHB-886]
MNYSTASKNLEELQLDSSASVERSELTVSEPVIRRYFETFNDQNFQATASLFAAEGALYPPFEDALVGCEAIAGYLQKEAKGMKALPQQETFQVLDNGNTEYKVGGKVLTAMFGVNVAWQFVLDPESKILSLRIKLLAALEELLSLKR